LLCQLTGARHRHGTCCARLCRRTLLRLGLREIYQLEDGQRGKAAQGCRCTRVIRERRKCCRQVLCETCRCNCTTRVLIFEHERLSREPKGKGRELLQILISRDFEAYRVAGIISLSASLINMPSRYSSSSSRGVFDHVPIPHVVGREALGFSRIASTTVQASGVSA
jgi:hypothetical protein